MKRYKPPYYAFISYCGSDEKWAKWLHKKLEYCHIPSELCKEHPNLPKKIRPVFWYKQDLSGTKLRKSLHSELNESKYLIVICSPESAKAFWVNDEVQAFIAQGKGDKIIPFIVSGTPHSPNPKEECFPKALQELSKEEEIRGIDVHRKEGKMHALVDVIATMFGIRFDELWQRHERRRKKIRNITIAFLTTLLFLISCIFYIEKPEYIFYADFTEVNGKPLGIRCLSDISNRHVSYKFVYKRLHFFDKQRTLSEVIRVNSKEVPIDDTDTPVMLSDDSFLKNQFPIIKLIYNDNRQLIGISFSDKMGTQKKEWRYIRRQNKLLAEIYTTNRFSDSDFQNTDTKREKSNIKMLCFDLDANGQNEKITFHSSNSYNLKNSKTKNAIGIYGLNVKRDKRKRIIRIENIGENGEVAYSDNGIMCADYKYKGDLITDEILNDGNSKINDFGYNISNITYDKNDNVICIKLLDYNKQLKNGLDGYAIERATYTDGNISQVEYFDQNRLRTNHKKTKCHLWKKKYNKKGYCIETSFYDTNRNLRNGSNGYAIAKYDYDSHGNLCEESYVNDNGEPCISKIIGVHKIQKKYDKYGNCTYAKCYNINNNPCFNKEGYCSQRTKYDDVGNITSVELFDVKDDLIIGNNGYAIKTADYSIDDEGNSYVTYSDYGKQKEAIITKNCNSHAVRCTYNNEGAIIKEEYYDNSMKPCTNKYGFSIVRYLYDHKGRRVSAKYFDQFDKLCNRIEQSTDIFGEYATDSIIYANDRTYTIIYKDKNGNAANVWHGVSVVEYKKNRNIEYASCYDAIEGNLINNADSFAVRKLILNERKEPVSVSYYNMNYSPCKIKMGISSFEYKFDYRGNIIKTSYYNENHQLTDVIGAAVIIFKYDSRDLLVEAETFSSQGSHYYRNGAYCIKRNKYDIYDNCIEESFWKSNKQRTYIDNDNYAIVKKKYDNFGNITEMSFFDQKAKATNCENKYHKVITKYDHFGRAVLISYYGLNEEPVCVKQGWALIKNNYDKASILLQSRIFLKDDKTVIGSELFKYNTDGTIQSIKRFDGNNQLLNEGKPGIMTKNGFVIVEWSIWDISKPIDPYFDILLSNLQVYPQKVVGISVYTKELTNMTITSQDIIQEIIPFYVVKELESLYFDNIHK